MNEVNRADAFLDVFRSGILASQEKERLATLGDRDLYLGLSDLARYQECPRSAVAGKIMAKTEDLATLLTLQRGHWFEAGVAEGFAALGLKQMRQVEITCRYQDTPIKGHLDIVLVWDKPYPAVRILEIKSMENPPATPYQSHQWQITAQAALLKNLWSQPVFAAGRFREMSFPQLCGEQLGLKIPVDIQDCSVEGWLLCISMTGAKVYGPFDSDTDFLEDLGISAVTMWRQMKKCKAGNMGLNDIPYAMGFYPLCGYCHVNADCPRFCDCDVQPQWEEAISRLDQLKANRSRLDAEIGEIETTLRQIHEKSGLDGWITTGGHRFRVSQSKGRVSLDSEALRSELKEMLQADGIDVDAIFKRHEKQGSPSSRLLVNKIN